jgi:hypothetical protein
LEVAFASASAGNGVDMDAIQRGIVMAAFVVLAVGAGGCSKKSSNTGGGSGGFGPSFGGAINATGGTSPGATAQGGAPAMSPSGSGGAIATGTGGAPMAMMPGTGGTLSMAAMDASVAVDGAMPADGGALADGEVPAAQCAASVMAAGTTITDCERCLCQPGHCQAQLKALDGDKAGNALVACTKQKNCADLCCLCGATCDSLGANYGMGPCASELETAAGATPGAGVSNASILMMNCPTTASPATSCSRAAALGQCVKDKCADMCPKPPACQ